jgi:hypothetical protein
VKALSNSAGPDVDCDCGGKKGMRGVVIDFVVIPCGVSKWVVSPKTSYSSTVSSGNETLTFRKENVHQELEIEDA